MSNTRVKKTNFKETVKNTGTKIGNYVDKKYQSAKASVIRYKDDISLAYSIGYSRGWDDCYDIPNRFGSENIAAYGYKKGVKNHRKSDKYIKQYNSRSKQN